jgi:protein-disulfide isomerase
VAKSRSKAKTRRRKGEAAATRRRPDGPPPTGGAPSAKAWIGLAVGLAVALVVVLVAASRLGSGGDRPEAITPEGRIAGAGDVQRLLEGIPQDGVALGDPDAPVTLIEFADLQCPFCAQFSREAFPALVREYVRAGELRVLFRPLTFIGEDSEEAARAVLAAGEQDRLWHAVDLFYRSQGGENSGWVDDELLGALGPSIPGLDGRVVLAEVESAAVDEGLAAAADAARDAGVDRTPFFLLGETGGELAPFRPETYAPESFRGAIERLLRR